MHLITEIFGEGKDLNTLQMCCRGVVIFLIALALIRLSGRRSFGLHNPMDNIIVILLGATLSRTVVGATPFIPVTVTCLAIVLLHRVFGWLIISNKKFGELVEGREILVYSDGRFKRDNMRRALLSEADVMQGVRKTALTDDLNTIDKIYMERNGEISAVLKKR